MTTISNADMASVVVHQVAEGIPRAAIRISAEPCETHMAGAETQSIGENYHDRSGKNQRID